MQIETLEGRRFFSATVVEAYPGFYEVHGDVTNDVIDVVVSQSAQSFTLDGTTYTGVTYIYVHGYSGDDQITVYSAEGPGGVSASVSAGDGNDMVNLNFDGAVWAGGGADVVYLADAYRGEIYGEAGDDHLYVSGISIDPAINGGSGNDMIDASGNWAGVAIDGDSGDDTIHGSEYDDEIRGSAGADSLYGHGGNDVFYAREGQPDQIFGGDGADIAYVDADGDGVYEVEYVFAE